MAFFVVTDKGSYALAVEVWEADSFESLLPDLPKLNDDLFDKREIVELTSEPGKPRLICAAGHVE